jgi:hypothetical protein
MCERIDLNLITQPIKQKALQDDARITCRAFQISFLLLLYGFS